MDLKLADLLIHTFGGEAMGANSTQAVGILLMLIAFVLLGLAFAGGGVLALAGAVLLIAVSCMFSLKAKSPQEAK